MHIYIYICIIGMPNIIQPDRHCVVMWHTSKHEHDFEFLRIRIRRAGTIRKNSKSHHHTIQTHAHTTTCTKHNISWRPDRIDNTLDRLHDADDTHAEHRFHDHSLQAPIVQAHRSAIASLLFSPDRKSTVRAPLCVGCSVMAPSV